MYFFIFFVKKRPTLKKSCILNMRKQQTKLQKNVVCKLHNEVFTASEIRLNTECSLISSEGISYSQMWPEK